MAVMARGRGKLTALRYPEETLVSVAAKMVYCEPIRPLDYKENETKLSSQQENDDENEPLTEQCLDCLL